MHSCRNSERTYQRLDAMASRAQTSAQRTRTIYWAGALTWILALQAGATWSAIPVATLIPVSFPILVWIKQRVERSRHFQVWCNARLAAEIARVLCVYASCGRGAQRFTGQLADRLLEFRAPPRRMITQLLSTSRRHERTLGLDAMLLHQRQWIEGQNAYLARTMPRREMQVRNMTRLSRVFYGGAIVLALVGIASALAGHRFIDSWIGFLVFTAPSVASVIGIFYSDVADMHDIARFRVLHARYQDAIAQLDASPDARQALAVFDQLAYLQTIEVIDWWSGRAA